MNRCFPHGRKRTGGDCSKTFGRVLQPHAVPQTTKCHSLFFNNPNDSSWLRNDVVLCAFDNHLCTLSLSGRVNRLSRWRFLVTKGDSAVVIHCITEQIVCLCLSLFLVLIIVLNTLRVALGWFRFAFSVRQMSRRIVLVYQYPNQVHLYID